MKKAFHRLSLTRQFLMVSFPVLLAGTLAIGWWVGRQVEDSVVHRIGSVTALYVDSFVAPHIQSLLRADELSAQDKAALAADLDGTELGKKIVALKIWRHDGYVLFSNDGTSAGKKFSIEEGLASALEGKIFSEISVRSDDEQSEHGQPLPRLIETYTPVHADGTGAVIAAAEFYVLPDEIDREAGAAQWRSWLLVAGAMLSMYLGLFLIVRRGSHTIEQQQRELGEQVRQLTALNEQNLKLRQRVSRAAERATAFNENFLQRLSADLHDGPGQDLGFALMQLNNMAELPSLAEAATAPVSKGLDSVRLAVQSALKDLRAISADLELPDIAPLAPQEIAARVIRDFQTKTGAEVGLLAPAPFALASAVSFRLKLVLYRLLQESLANALRHAQCKDCRVELRTSEQGLDLQISDSGPGFDIQLAAKKGRLGLHGMRQRVEVLGGIFELQTAVGAGTLIRVHLPFAGEPHDDE